ncbi:carbon-phosphorus lyase complex subunit PhnI [Roseiterribacter gracilis]|uniref:Carbon-phosphorus lyase complex subunit PhnI n=1 Tax=Roseiterribacter gracilis TaxID=2812848 RepID=A0A8S8X649_9PROT|nr:carbon-phosphorus lyase complex subunit PhnI [Rhodospirillales bacterium TMPK1]
MYVAVKGGAAAIRAAHELLADVRRGDRDVPQVDLAQIDQQLGGAVDRVMAEASLYDRELAAVAIRQARGDLFEAVFLLRAYRTTLPRLGDSEPLNTGAMQVDRRISATFKDLPGGQVLGATFDYTHRLLDFELDAPDLSATTPVCTAPPPPRVGDLLGADGLIEPNPDDGSTPADITRDPPTYPASRAARLQALSRGDEGFLLALGYSTQRGYGWSHPFAGEIRRGFVDVEFVPEELGFAITIGKVEVTEVDMVNHFSGTEDTPPCFTRGYGLAFGHGERKAMSMALVDRALRAAELGEDVAGPAQDQEFVLSHCDNVEASGFVQHLKLPHYVDFQAELDVLRRLRAERIEEEALKEAAE